MPIEIRELVIRAVVDRDPAAPAADDEQAARAAVVEEAVRAVLAVLRRQRER